ncbi:MAG: hypothetical protein IKE75_03020 [Bacilli bacterium]|nr:hypothetical protein [Bacilli bacterium]
MNKNIIKIMFMSVLLTCLYFTNIDGVKACNCYYDTGWFEYAASVDPTGSTSSSQMRALLIMDFNGNNSTVVNSCVGMRTYSEGTNAYKPGKNMLYVESFDKCTLKDFDKSSPFNVDAKKISGDNCSIASCDSANLFYANGKGVRTNGGLGDHKFGAVTYEQHQAAIDEDEKTKQEEKGVQDIDISIVKPFDSDIKEAAAGSHNCDLIPPRIMKIIKNFFFIIQVIGILLLVALSFIEFIKAITASSEDGLLGALKNTYRRIIIVVVLLLLPMLVIWILNIVNANAYETDQNGKRVIGTNNQPLCKW